MHRYIKHIQYYLTYLTYIYGSKYPYIRHFLILFFLSDHVPWCRLCSSRCVRYLMRLCWIESNSDFCNSFDSHNPWFIWPVKQSQVKQRAFRDLLEIWKAFDRIIRLEHHDDGKNSQQAHFLWNEHNKERIQSVVFLEKWTSFDVILTRSLKALSTSSKILFYCFVALLLKLQVLWFLLDWSIEHLEQPNTAEEICWWGW